MCDRNDPRALDALIALPIDHGNAMHSFVLAGDVATAIHKLLTAGAHVCRQAFNIAYPETSTTKGFILACAEVCGKTPRLYPLNLEAADRDVKLVHQFAAIFIFASKRHLDADIAQRAHQVALNLIHLLMCQHQPQPIFTPL